MAYTLFIHLLNEQPLLLDVEELPDPSHQWVIGKHPRQRDNKEVHYVLAEVTTVMFPITRISFIEVMPTGEDEEIFRPFRE